MCKGKTVSLAGIFRGVWYSNQLKYYFYNSYDIFDPWYLSVLALISSIIYILTGFILFVK